MIENGNTDDPGGGRADEFAQLLAMHETQLFGYIYALILNMADAEDIYQDTALALWRKFEDYQPGTNFAAWARATARFEVQHFLRSKSRRRVHFDERLLAELAETQTDLDSGGSDSSLEAYSQALLRCRDKLPENDQQLVSLCYGGSRSITDAAKQLGRSPQSVCNSLSRIRRVLFDCIRRAAGGEAEDQ
jgi:RNA polymerase sigma-70 factor, ECF subfamily